MKKKKTFFLLVVFIIAISAFSDNPGQAADIKVSESENGVYYVAVDGNDNNPGTLKLPWRTIQKAADNVSAGDVVYVRGGSYHEKVKMKASGLADGYITFQNYEGEIPVINGEGLVPARNDNENALIIMNNKSYIKIKGFHITNFVSDNEYVPAGIRVTGSGTGIEILDCKVYGIKTTYTGNIEDDRNAHGIAVYGTNGNKPLDNLIIDSCEIYDNILGTSEAVVLNGNVVNFKVTNNKVHDNDNIGIDFIGFEGTADSNDQVRDGICSGNEVWNISSVNNGVYEDACAGGIYVDGGRNILIERNKIWNCDIGIEAASEHKGRTTEIITIRNNLVYGCKAVAGIAFGGYDRERGNAENIKIFNNTLYDNKPNILIQQHCQSDTNVIKNNILYKGTAFSGNVKNIAISHNITEDPKFVNEKEKDFHLLPISPAIDAGVYDLLIGEFDLDNNARIIGGGVDCGTYESY